MINKFPVILLTYGYSKSIFSIKIGSEFVIPIFTNLKNAAAFLDDVRKVEIQSTNEATSIVPQVCKTPEDLKNVFKAILSEDKTIENYIIDAYPITNRLSDICDFRYSIAEYANG